MQRRHKPKLVALNLEPPTPIHAFDEEVEVEDYTRQMPSPQNSEDRTNLNPMFTPFKIPTFPSSAQLAERMMDPMAIPHTTGDVQQLDTSLEASVHKAKRWNNRMRKMPGMFQRLPNPKLAAPKLEPSKPLRAFDEEVEDVDCTRPTLLPKNPEDLSTASPKFEIPAFSSTTQLPERTIPDTTSDEDHSLAKADPESYNYKGQDHRSYTEYLDTLRSESWKLKALNSRPQGAYVYDSTISEHAICLYSSQQISNDRVYDIEPCANFSQFYSENGGLVNDVPTTISQHLSSLFYFTNSFVLSASTTPNYPTRYEYLRIFASRRKFPSFQPSRYLSVAAEGVKDRRNRKRRKEEK
ncbi:MAG: hypothetical protein NXY57DRAFT_1044369 [Lentinula lateritia]|nr:MAG: hypothetical protein NXY57DRAFT_1044369 [Lentinula lateritia]